MEITGKKRSGLSVTMHILAWFLLIILPQLIIDRYWGSSNYFAWGFYLNAALYGILFYANYLWLVPQFYFKGKKPTYILSAIGVIAVLYFVSMYVNNNFIHTPERDKVFREIFDKMVKENVIPRQPFRQLQVYYFILISLVVTGFSLGLKIIEQHAETEKRQKELEKEKLNSELAFLKNQVSPHFFFNTLNNIYSLIEINAKDAQESVLKLSKLMRYLLYESEHGETLLCSEIDFMNHYIDLMKLRLSKKVELQVDLVQPENNIKIPPLLFIPFIENAFKHGISYRDKSFIHIKMNVEKDNIKFSCINSLGQQSDKNQEENHSGIGLENVKKRLSLLFPGKHNLKIDKSNMDYSVSLEIEI